ncbi:MAG: hypothetical protein QM756_39300 [Polyangiaceae bacterium]
MSARARGFCFCMGLLTLLCSVPVRAEADVEEASLAQAEQAYQEVDFERAFQLGRAALEAGRASRQESVRLYVLLGVSAAALGREDDARRYFSVALSIDPTRKLERSLSPKIRGPYLEAEAALSLYGTPLAISAAPNAAGQRLKLTLEDPQALVAKLDVWLRPLGQAAFRKVSLSARHESALPLEAAWVVRGYEYSARALDSFGNVLAELGSVADPVTVAAAAPKAAPPKVSLEPIQTRRTPWLAIGLGTVGVAAAGAGAYFQVRRESAAREWNGPACERAGASRGEQCAAIDSDRRRFETAAIAGYALGGALVVGGVTAWLLGRESPSTASDRVGLACGLLGGFASCSGRF